MLSKRFTSINQSLSPGINSKGHPTINVSGDEVALEAYFRILDLADAGKTRDEIVSHIIKVTESDPSFASAKFTQMVDNILENQRLSQASGTILGVKHVSAKIATGNQQKSRKSNTLQKARRVTTHSSASEPPLASPASPEREEEKLVVEALKLMTMRDSMTKDLPDSPANRSVAAAIDQKLRTSLQKHQAIDEQHSPDTQLRIELAQQNLR